MQMRCSADLGNASSPVWGASSPFFWREDLTKIRGTEPPSIPSDSHPHAPDNEATTQSLCARRTPTLSVAKAEQWFGPAPADARPPARLLWLWAIEPTAEDPAACRPATIQRAF